MSSDITTITLALPFRLGRVNCDLVKTAQGYILIDTGSSNQRAVLEQALLKAGGQPGSAARRSSVGCWQTCTAHFSAEVCRAAARHAPALPVS